MSSSKWDAESEMWSVEKEEEECRVGLKRTYSYELASVPRRLFDLAVSRQPTHIVNIAITNGISGSEFVSP